MENPGEENIETDRELTCRLKKSLKLNVWKKQAGSIGGRERADGRSGVVFGSATGFPGFDTSIQKTSPPSAKYCRFSPARFSQSIKGLPVTAHPIVTALNAIQWPLFRKVLLNEAV